MLAFLKITIYKGVKCVTEQLVPTDHKGVKGVTKRIVMTALLLLLKPGAQAQEGKTKLFYIIVATPQAPAGRKTEEN